MNFKSREIAGVLNIGLTSVDKSRQRLRKKINIDAKADLFDYLKNI
jgi:FixJ family two-component response regulator